jgi:trk system potassium uptake protein TrkA
MHVVIGGCGRVGAEMTVSLSRQGHTVSVIDKDPVKFERLPPGFDGRTFVGLVFDRETLEAAGIREAGAYIAVTNGDNSNIVSARVAREAYGVEKVVARIYDPRRAEIYRRLGIPTVATVQWASAQIFDLLFEGLGHTEIAFGDGETVMLRVDIPSSFAGKPVSSLTEGDPRAVVSVINRMGSVMIPGPNATFQEGDIAHIVLHRDAIQNLRARLAAPAVAEHH